MAQRSLNSALLAFCCEPKEVQKFPSATRCFYESQWQPPPHLPTRDESHPLDARFMMAVFPADGKPSFHFSILWKTIKLFSLVIVCSVCKKSKKLQLYTSGIYLTKEIFSFVWKSAFVSRLQPITEMDQFF